MAVGRGLLIDRSAQLELPDDLQRAEVEVLVDQLLDGGDGAPLGAEGLDETRDLLPDPDRVGNLDLAVARQSSRDDVLGHVAGGVRSRMVDLGRILPAEAAAAGPGIAAVAVDDDLPAGDAGVGPRSTKDEAAGGVDVDRRPLVEDLRGNDPLADELF